MESQIKEDKKIAREQFHNLDVRKDFLSRFLFDRWQNYFAVLLFLVLSTLVANFCSGSLMKIDLNSLPYEKVALLKEGIPLVPYVGDIGAVEVIFVAVGFFFLARRFFSSIPQALNTILENGTLKKKKGSRKDNLRIDYSNSLEDFENLINRKWMYALAVPPYVFVIAVSYIYRNPIGDLNWVMWNDINVFPLSWIASNICASLMWFYVGIFLYKMLSLVFFMRRLSSHYEFSLNPFDPDGFGGFKPFGQLWLNINLIAVLILVTWLVMFLSFRSFGVVNPLQPRIELFIIIVYSISITILLIYPMQNYHRIVENEKTNLLKNIERRINEHYNRIEKVILSEKKRNLDSKSVEQMKYYHEIALKVKSIPSWPFTLSEKISISLSIIVPWILQSIQYLVKV